MMEDGLWCTERFNIVDGPTVLTRRNFGLTRGRSLQDAANLLLLAATAALSDKRRLPSPPLSPSSSSSCSSSGANSPKYKFGHGGFGDKSANIWEWPLGEATVVNTERTFHAKLVITPFSCEDITASVMGSELFIHCKGEKPYSREFYRSYQLPLNIEPRSVKFAFKNRRFLLVTAQKEQPLKMAVAFALSDEDEEDNSM